MDESPDDDQMSAYSDESITPETAVRPDYMQTKISASDCRIDDNDCREDLATVREAWPSSSTRACVKPKSSAWRAPALASTRLRVWR